MKTIRIGDQAIGEGQPCYVIAEAGVNHNGDVALALRLVDAAAEVGADAVKFQTFRADAVAAPLAPKADYQVRTTGDNESQRDMLRRLELSRDDHHRILQRCRERRITFLSTPFDSDSADLLVELGVPALKVPSGEITNRLLLEHLAGAGLPVILSTGMSDLAEVAAAVEVMRRGGCGQLALLHCVSNYPARPQDANLHAMRTLTRTFMTPVGYSDHTAGAHVALAAVALGARVLEKHLTLDRTLAGPDHAASMEPGEWSVMMRQLREIEAALGDGVKRPTVSELPMRDVVRRRLVAACDIDAGRIITRDMIAALRPEATTTERTGICPMALDAVVGRAAPYALRRGDPIAAAA